MWIPVNYIILFLCGFYIIGLYIHRALSKKNWFMVNGQICFYLLTHLFIYLFIYEFIYLFICLFFLPCCNPTKVFVLKQ